MKRSKSLIATAIVVACAAAPLAARAQSTSAGMSDADWESGRATSYSLLPYTSYGYVGLNLGRSNWDTPCVAGFPCENGGFSGKIYTGGLISRMVGLEVGYVSMGEADRAGGEWKAHGVNASVVANLPIDPVNVFAKVGTTYGWTEAEPRTATTGLPRGDDSGFGLTFGAGVGFDVTRNLQLLAEWDRQEFRFVTGKDDIDLYSLGVKYKF